MKYVLDFGHRTGMLKDFKFVSVKGNLVGWIHKDLYIDALKSFLDHPEGFLHVPRSQILRDNPKTKVVKQAFESPGGVKRDVIIKRFAYPSLWRRVGFIFLSPPARRSFRGSLVLIEHGIATAFPLAILDPRGLQGDGKSYYITEEVEDGQTLDAFWAETSTRQRQKSLRDRLQILNEIASLFYRLHSSGIYHADLKGANILIRKRSESGWQCVLVDVDDVRKSKRLRWPRRIKNLVQLVRTFGQHLTGREKIYLIKRYADLFSLERGGRRALMTKVLAEVRRDL